MIFAKLTHIFALLIGLLASVSSGELSSPHNALLDLINVHANTTNDKLIKFFNDPKGLLSFMDKADPKQIDQVLVFIDTIIADSLEEKEAILACRDEKQAFVDRALKKRTTETDEHTKIKAELVEAGEKVKDLEKKETDARTLVDTLQGRYDVASIDVKNCQDEVDKLTKQTKEETEIYNQIIDLLQECAGNTKTKERFDFIRGPKLSNGLYKKCSKPFKSLKDAEAACLADSSCGWLHDYGCDSKDWRTCKVSVKRVKGDKKGCSFIKPSASNTTVENFKDGPKVGNGIYKQCKKKKYTREGAKAACLADKSCGWVHDWGCDNKNWRVCASSVKRSAGDRQGCSLVRKTPAVEKKPPTPKAKKKPPTPKSKKKPAPTPKKSADVVVPPPLKSSFETKWGLDGWTGFSEVNTGYRIPSDGSIKLWEYVAGSKSGVYFQVYRLVSGTRYKLIGQNFVKKSVKGKTNKVKVTGKKRINVRKGDFIGWTFVGKAAFGFSTSQGRTNWATGNKVAYTKVGGTFNFPGTGKRLYQCRATISPGQVNPVKTPSPTPKSKKKKTASVVVPPPLKNKFETKWGLDGWQGFSEVNTGYKIPSDGSISQWEYVGGSASGVYFQIYRFVSGTKYKLIGENFVKKSVKGKINQVRVPSASRINVKKGDFIGWTFIGKAAFGFSSSQGTTNWATGNGVAYRTIGGTFNFPGRGKRLYQCRATVSPKKNTKPAVKTPAPTKKAATSTGVIVPPPLKTSFESKWGLDGWQSFSEVNTGYAIPSAGSITLWEYLGGSASAVYLQVWRKVSGKKYKLIGQNFIKKSVKGKNNKVNVLAKNRIVVKKGDFIGWTFVGKAAFGFSSSQGRTNWAKSSGVNLKKVGGTLNFPGSGKRLYQCRATVSPVSPSNASPPTKAGKASLVVVPPPLKTSFETKWGLDGWQGFSEVNTGYKIPLDGSVSLWEYVGGSNSGVYLQVYRFVSGTKYKLIGQNFVKKSIKGKTNKVQVKSKNRIAVKRGDFIGWTFVGRAAFGFSSSQGTTNWATGNRVAYKTVGGTFNFPGRGRRLYQIRASISGKTTSPGNTNKKVVVPSPLKTSYASKRILDGWKSFSLVNTGYAIPSAGSIILWEYLGGSTSAVYLQVWRKVSGKNYKLIGQNFVKKSVKGKNNKVNVKAKNRIVVKKGDFIGWTFVGKAAFGFSSSQGRTNWARANGVSLKKVGGTLNFPGSGKRLYQCRATVLSKK